MINKRCTRFAGCTTRMKYYITWYYFIPISIQDVFIYINLVNFLSCLKVDLYIIWSTFGGFFGGGKSKLYKPVFYEYEQCMYICFSYFSYFDLLLSTNFECRLWYMYCYWDSWVIEYQNYIYLSVCKWKAFNSRSYFCI